MKGAKGPMRGDQGRMRAGPGDAQEEDLLVMTYGHYDEITGENDRLQKRHCRLRYRMLGWIR